MTTDKNAAQNKPIAAVDGAELEGEVMGAEPAEGEGALLGGSAIEPGGDVGEEVAVTLMASFWPRKQWLGYVLVK